MPPREKRCSKCGLIKPVSDFHKRKPSPDGFAYKCAECVKKACRDWREKNPGAFSKWHIANRDRRADYWAEWYSNNKERRSASYKKWAQENKHIVNALIAKRNAAKRKQTPSWANLDAIRAIYKRAAELTRETGVKYEVDHIYPLQGKTSSGLHCEANLQILPKVENIRKSNRAPEEFGMRAIH